MGGADGVGNDWTFKANYSGEGAVMLRERIMEKLKEFMGDYTDDTLVEYVIVLLRNGRCKEEAKRELNVFLGDDSDSFVSWLWDHLSLNLHLYVQPTEPLPDDTAIIKVTETGINSHRGQASGASRTGSEHDGGNPLNVSRSRRKREWNGLVGELSENFPLRSTVTEALHSEQNIGKNPDVWRSTKLRSQLSSKRTREDERRKTKRATDLLPKLAPSLRLLEFAVRDAVKTVQPSISTAEPSVKRLRSVVFSSIDATMVEKPQRPRSTSKNLGPVSVALKAAAEAAEDVSKSRNAGNIFGKLGHGRAAVEPIDHSSNLKESILHDGENEEFGPITRSGQVDYKKNEYKGEFSGINSLFERDADMPADSASDNDGYDDFSISNNHNLEASQGVYSSNKKENSAMLYYNVSKYTDAASKKKRLVKQDPSPGASTKPSSKVVNISVNVNTWKPTDYELYKNAKDGKIQIGEKNEEATVKSNVNIPHLKENTASILGNDKEMTLSDMQKDFRKSQASTPGICYTSSRPSDDVDSRTIFISNVHFAATKDTLSRHFNKFGEVLKVMIVTDPVNGQPIGSAYVEFLRKESAEMALSLSGTSFMSRILKVVLRNFADAPVMAWPRISRASSFASRFGRMPLPRGILPGAIHACLPIKPGARSMQWRRDSAASRTSEGAKSVRNMPSMPGNATLRKTGRNLKYVRPDSTNIGNFGPS